MQTVERQKHKNRRPGRLTGVLLCAVLLAACVAAGLLLRKEAGVEPGERRERITGAITRRGEEELKSLTVIRRGKSAWTVLREEDGSLRIQAEDTAEPGAWTVDESIGRMLTDAAVNLTFEDVYTEDRADWEPELEAFGLADPLVTAVIRFTDGTEVTARIGNPSDPEEKSSYYMAVDGHDRLYAVPAGTVEDLDIEKELLHPVRQPEIRGALLDRITVKNGDGSVRTEWVLQGQITDRDAAENWLLTVPFVYPADYDAMKNLRDIAEDLRLGIYIGSAEEETLKRCGLNEPAAVIELHMAAGSTGTVGESGVYDVEDREESTETLIIGGSRSEMTAYVRFGDDIYTMNYFSLNAFTETEPLSTAARYPVATPLNSLESVTVEKQGEEAVRYSLVRTDSLTAESAATDEAEYRCLRNGEEISCDVFSAAWERLLTVTVSGKLPDGYRPGETHTKYTFRTVSGGTHTVGLSDYDGMHDAVTMDGHTLFYLIKNGMTELP